MSDRITKEHLQARAANLNGRMESRGSGFRYEVSGRNGYTAIDRTYPDGTNVSFVAAGTKTEIGQYLHLMMVALDDAAYREEPARQLVDPGADVAGYDHPDDHPGYR